MVRPPLGTVVVPWSRTVVRPPAATVVVPRLVTSAQVWFGQPRLGCSWPTVVGMVWVNYGCTTVVHHGQAVVLVVG